MWPGRRRPRTLPGPGSDPVEVAQSIRWVLALMEGPARSLGCELHSGV